MSSNAAKGRSEGPNSTGRERAGGRGWSWAALVAGLLIWFGGLPTFGLSIFFSPVSIALAAVAWWRSPRDTVYWIGFALNVVLAIGLLSLLVGLAIGDVGIDL